jgi:hypothetical protein
MNDLLMPSEMKKAAPDGGAAPGAPSTPPVEPPSARLIVQLFLVPLIIVAAAVGVMFLIGVFAGAGGTPSFEQALQRLKNPGGGRTADLLVGPGSKQRYMDAKTVADKIMKVGADPAERVKISDDIIDVIDNHTTDDEGEVRHFLLLTLGRAWQLDPNPANRSDSPAAAEARQRALATLFKYADSKQVSNQKAAILSLAYWAGRPEVRSAFGKLIEKLRDESQDLDVRLAAATVLGPIATPNDRDVIDGLNFALRDTNPANIELVWGSALSLAQLNQKEVADTILMLLDREELAKAKVLDRETDPKNPTYRTLSDQEQQRILINTMIGAARLDAPTVQDKLRWLEQNDPSPRVRAAAQEVIQSHKKPPASAASG